MKGAVTASTQSAADAGVSILGAGGNAVDAAIAAALATCVADPCNTGIAGYGGYLVVQRSGEAAKCVQFPLCAPSNASPQGLAKIYPEAGPACSSVPNVVAGLACALAGFGRLSWEKVSVPAIALAREGVSANATNTRAFEQHRHRPFVSECFVLEEIEAGDRRELRFSQPALARTLERIAEHGPEWFYRGPLGDAAQGAWREAGIDIPESDWREQGALAEIVDAASHDSDGVRVNSAPLGLSGSGRVFAMFAAAGRIAQAMPLASPEGLAELASAMASTWQVQPAAAETAHTAHLNAVDEDGMVAALTFTHGPAWFGGRWALPQTGVIMNGGMHNFSRAAPLRRGSRWFGVSNMAPTAAVNAAGARIALGCPGARRIPSNVALVLARHFIAGESLQAAVSGGRLHTEGRDRVFWEDGRLGAETRAALQARFESVEAESADNYFGPLTALRIAASGEIEAAVDDRIWQGFDSRTGRG